MTPTSTSPARRLTSARFAGCVSIALGWLASFGMAGSPARAIAPDEIPSPRDRGSWVSDAADRLSQPAEQLLDDTLDAFHDERHNDLAVVVVSNTGSATPEQLAAEFRDTWGIGQETKDSGILLLISTDDRQAAIDFGDSLSWPPSQREIDRLLETRVLPELENDNYDRAAIAGVDALIEAFTLSPDSVFTIDLLVKVIALIVIGQVVRHLILERRAKARE